MRAVGASSLASSSRIGVQIELFACHGLQVADHHGQRRAQLVGDVGDEVLAHGQQPVELGDVAHQQQRVVVVDDDAPGLQAALLVEGRGELDQPVAARAADQRNEVGLAYQRGEIGAAVGWLQVQTILGGQVEVVDGRRCGRRSRRRPAARR
jgi:hypothetical protein